MSKNLNYFISRYEDSISKLVQVGAHFGQELEIFDQYNVDNVYLFEPLPEAHVELEKKIKNNPKYELFKFGLGSKSEIKNCFTQMKIKDKVRHF